MFFVFHKLTDHPMIQEAFELICGVKLRTEYYVDMERFIAGRIDKKAMYQSLLDMNSRYAFLYQAPYPTEENIYAAWSAFEVELNDGQGKASESTLDIWSADRLNEMEAQAIINWIYRAYGNMKLREQETESALKELSRAFQLPELAFGDEMIYVRSQVEMIRITSFGSFYKAMQDIESASHTFYYRGHSDANYRLLPSIMRRTEWLAHERDMYNELLIECPQEFVNCTTHLETLVHMQHYGLPTRLLDVTRNPLVALYFACTGNPDKKGEVIVFDVLRDKVKYPGSDTATVLASLPLFDQSLQDQFAKWALDSKVRKTDFNKKITRLLHEIKLEKPAFRDDIMKRDILDCFFVLSEKKNNRIIKQDGAFIICGLFQENANAVNQYRFKIKKKIQIYVIQARKKKEILKMLEKFSITKASLFPEIADVTEFLKEKY